jgi:hypothetical protein
MTPKEAITLEAEAEYPVGENHFFAKRRGYERAANKSLSIIEEKDKEIDRLKASLKEIEEIALKYHNENGNSPAANHCRNIAMEALSKNK